MTPRNLIAPAAIITAAVPMALVAPAPYAQAAPMEPYHIANVTASNSFVAIYADWLSSSPHCGGSRVQLNPGDDAGSTGWDCFRAPRAFNVLVFDGSTGALLADRSYPAYTDVRAYPSNRYRVQVTG